ncbi:MAG: hypothetical protein QOG35_902 [Solirubrobacteraceae bacterium]|nr:hypothetical protein [Solirubrobacteraceae bacterium]
MSSSASPRSWTPSALPAWALAALLAGAWLVVRPPSGDLAAQHYRAGLGLVLWDNGWYGGHHMPAYGVLFGLLASAVGPLLVGALSAVAAAWLFERLVRDLPGARAGALWFAAATATSLLTGRLTFALGVALALGALLAAARGRPAWACALAVLTSLASPVAAAFVALAAAAWWLDRRGWWPVALAAAALAPLAALSLAFPEGGTFPFAPSSFWPALAMVLAVLAVLPREPRVVRLGAALYAAALAVSFALHTAMGGNAVRLGTLVAGPVLACLLWRRRPRVLAALAVPLLYWQWVAPVDNVASGLGDPSVHEGYYAGLLQFLERRPGGPFRIEIPFTGNHGEARWVAPHVPLARGWERQLDVGRNRLFYDGRPLTAARYRRWLDDNAVRYVALADAPLDDSAVAEARLVRGGLPYLREVWSDRHWRVFAVAGARPLASGAASATALGTQDVRLSARRAGTVDLRVRFTPYWRIDAGRGCVAEGPGGWTRLRLTEPGPVALVARFDLGRVLATSPRCSS